MSLDNPLWGAPRIQRELLKLGFEVAQSTVAKYMVKRWGPPSQGWRTFLQNHAADIAAMDLFVAPTINFSLLYAFVILQSYADFYNKIRTHRSLAKDVPAFRAVQLYGCFEFLSLRHPLWDFSDLEAAKSADPD